MRKPILVVLLTLSVVLVIVSLIHFLPGPEKATDEPKLELPASFFQDSSGDGLNDWFKANVAGMDPDVANHRYIIYYSRHLDMPGILPYIVDKPVEFFIETGVLPENIIALTRKEANAVNLEQAINEVAAKSTKNDLVLLRIFTHGSPVGVEGGVIYTELDQWLDRIEAKAVVVVIMACHSEHAMPILKEGREGSSLRIVFVYSAVNLERGLGICSETFITVDSQYGNNDGYINLAELANWMDHDPRQGPDWTELRWEGRGHLEARGYSRMTDVHNIAHQIYLADYTPYEVPPAMEEYLESPST